MVIVYGFIFLLLVDLALFFLWIDTRKENKDLVRWLERHETRFGFGLADVKNQLKEQRDFEKNIHQRLHDLKEAQDNFVERHEEVMGEVDNYNRELKSILNFAGKRGNVTDE